MTHPAWAAGRVALALVLAAGAPARAQTPAGPLRLIPEQPPPGPGPVRLAVQVVQDTGRPAAGATVVFTFPTDGPSALFASGLRAEIVTADHEGRAAVAGLRWSEGPGACLLVVRATFGAAQGVLEWPLEAAAPSNESLPAYRSRAGGGKWLWAVLLAGGGAAAGALALKGKAPASPAAAGPLPLAVVIPTIGAPLVTVTRP